MIRVAIIGNVSRVLREGLEPDEKKEVDGWVKQIGIHPLENDPHHHMGHLHTQKAFDGSDDPHRITFPMKDYGNDIESDYMGDVTRHLDLHGYTVHDYKGGLAKQKGGNRQIKIGKLLGPGGAAEHYNLSQAFANDPAREDRKHDYSKDHSITISRHPHDVAGMSACSHPWDSCMNFKSGAENHHLPHEIKQGTMVAYLHHNDDPKMENPVARIAIRPHVATDGSHRIYRAEGSVGVYGKKAGGNFHKAVTNWANHNFPARDGHHYRRHETTYAEYPGPDGRHLHGAMDIHNMSDEDMSDYVSRRRHHPLPDHHYDHIVANGHEDTVERMTRRGGAHMDNLKRNLGALAKHHPQHYLDSGAFGKGIDSHHLVNTGEKSEVISGHDLIHKQPAKHAEQVIPGIGEHIKTIANSMGSNAHYAHEGILNKLSKAAPGSILDKHRDDIHHGVLRKPTLGKFSSSNVTSHLYNVQSCFDKHSPRGGAEGSSPLMSKPSFDKAMESADKLSQSFKPGKGSNWVHHTMNAHRAAPGSLSAESISADVAKDVVSRIKDHPHYDEARHGHVVQALEGK